MKSPLFLATAALLAVLVASVAATAARPAGFCEPPQSPPPAAPPEFDFPGDEPEADVDVELPTPAESGDETTITTILSGIAALAGGASGYLSMREGEDADEETIPDAPPAA